MKLEQFRSTLRQKVTPSPRKKFEEVSDLEKVRLEKREVKYDANELRGIMNLSSIQTTKMEESGKKKLKVIGITGSRGKSSVAYIVHNYLKNCGFRSILYSSIEIDSPVSFCAEKSAVENPIRDERMILDAIEDAIEYNADYLIIEVNERAIGKGLTKDIPFDIRVLTGIVPKHNDILYPNYVEIKKQFLREADYDTKLISTIYNNETISLVNELKGRDLVTFGSKYVSGVYNLDQSKIKYLLSNSDKDYESIYGLNMIVNINGKGYELSTNLNMPFHGMNITCSVAILNELNTFECKRFQNLISDINIPGRDEVIKYNNRTIIISTNLVPHLEVLKRYQSKGQVNKIRIVTGATGIDFVSWDKEFDDNIYLKDKEFSMSYAYNYMKQYADVVYVTTSDSGNANKEALISYQAKLLDNQVVVHKEVDRTMAIKKAINDSLENDVIFISGRGNRVVMCDSEDHIKLHLDKDVVINVLNNLKQE